MAAVSPVRAPTALPLQWPLVGRHAELELFAATLADPRAHGFVIHGAAGVGETRLADQCLAIAGAAGRFVARATATEGSRSAPLGALAHLLPLGIGDNRGDLVAVMAAVRPILRDQATNGALVLFVDDLHLLDVASATLLGQLVDADLIFLVATVRTAEEVPAGLESLWRRARVRRVDLDVLDRAAVDTLLHLVLHGPVDAVTVTELWSASEGNVLFVRELVLAALERGVLVEQRGVWRLGGSLVATPRLHELVATRLASLTPEAIHAVEVLAAWEPTSLSILEGKVGLEHLEVLDRSGLLAVRTDGRRQMVTLVHPLYGEILRDRVPALTRRRLVLEHADHIDTYGARRREDPIRLATARLDATGWADPELLLTAARLARHEQDFPHVERLGRAAIAGGMTAEAGLLLGEVLHERGSFEEADEVLTAADAAATDEEVRVYITEIRTRNLMWGLLRWDEALEELRRVRETLIGSGAAQELTLNEAMLLSYSGRPLEALAVVRSVGEIASPRARALAATAELPALIGTGRAVTAVDRAEQAYAEHSRLPDQLAIPSAGVHLILRTYALAEAGRLAEATALATMLYEATPETAPPDARAWVSFQLGRCSLLAGRVEAARQWLSIALARCDERRSLGPHRLVLSDLAAACAYAGDAGAAATAVRELDELPPFPFVYPEQEMGRAWAMAVAGDLPGARAVLLAAADQAARTGYYSSEGWLLHDAARLGDPTAVVDRLTDLATRCEGDLVASYAAHVRAAAAGQPTALVEAADRFERLGATLLAAEAMTEAAQAHQRAGDRRGANAAAGRATALASACEGARTPGLTTGVLVVPLTPRERDIAVLAAQGLSSQDIADRLFLSVRTVNNHLQSAYSKLGVAGRRQLAAALADVVGLSS